MQTAKYNTANKESIFETQEQKGLEKIQTPNRRQRWAKSEKLTSNSESDP